MRTVARFSLVVFLACGCLSRTPPVRQAQSVRVGIAAVVDDVHRKEAHDIPPAVRLAMQQDLAARNLEPVWLDPAGYVPYFRQVRDTERRLAHLAKLPGAPDVLLLVEAQAAFYSQLGGRYRWTVYVKLSLGARAAIRDAMIRQLELPAVLIYAHEREPEAVASQASEIARQLGNLLDAYFGGSAAAPAPADSIYFVLVDRFRDGDPANDGRIDRADPAAWHGGDLRGIIDRLDYLQSLGVRTLWLSPVFKTRYEPFMGHGAFHGYWTEDLTKVDPRFGTVADLRELARKLHRRGMRLLLDLVVNHVGYDAPLLRAHPDWFHPPRTIENWNDPDELVTHEVHGLPDLAQERPPVYAYLRRAAAQWITEVGIDGYRLDAVKHVALGFWGRFNGELERVHPGLVLLGEHYHGDPAVVDRVQRDGAFTHMFDFPMAFALRDVFCGGRPAGRIGAVLSSRRLYSNPGSLVTFLDNHDLPRVRTACGGDLARVRHALTAQFTLRGVPALTYGTEAGLEGAGEPQNRADMVFDDPRYRGLKEHVAKLLALRTAHPVLVTGRTRILGLTDGLLSFLRVGRDEVALVVINTSPGPRRLALRPPLAGLDLRDAFTGAPSRTAVEVQPRETRLLLAGAPRTGALDGLAGSAHRRRPVEVSVKGVELGPGEALFLVGSGPELGSWSPAAGVGPFARRARAYVASFELPVGLVFAYKLVVRGADGKAQWEPDEDRYVFVGDDDGTLALDLDFRRG